MAADVGKALNAVVKASHASHVATMREVAAYRRAHAAGASLRAIAGAAGVSPETVRRVLAIAAGQEKPGD